MSTLRIGALFPMLKSSGSLDQSGMLRLGAFLMAIDEINNKTDGIADDLLPKTRLDFVLRDSRRDNLAALIGALELVGTCGVGHSGGSSGIVAAIGAASSGPSESAAAAFARAKVPQISYSSTSPALSDGAKFPFFLRTPPSDAFQAEAMVDVLASALPLTELASLSTAQLFRSIAEARILRLHRPVQLLGGGNGQVDRLIRHGGRLGVHKSLVCAAQPHHPYLPG